MKALVTGGAGFIGANICKYLIDNGFAVTCLDDFLKGREANIKDLKLEFIKGSVADEKLIKSLKGKKFDCIFHEAAITDTTVEDKNLMLKVNVEGFNYILDLAKSDKTQVVYASSAAVYGDGSVPMKENQKLNPLNIYGVSKAKMDEIAASFVKDTGIKTIGLRYFNVYGPREDFKGTATSMIRQLANQMMAGKRPRIFKYGEQERDFIYVRDVVLANINAFESQNSGVVNVGTGKKVSFNQVIAVLNQVLRTKLETDYFDNPYGFYQNCTQADTALSEKLIGFKARFSVEEGIKDYIREIKK
jgi:ADP-L-glycero-D-manno-heptose 6-epimerase